jgi:hypothetical protein
MTPSRRTTLLAATLALAFACTGQEADLPVKPDGPERDFVTEARHDFPRALDVQVGVIARSCSPNPGVCHNASTYPDLTTAGSLLAMIESPCNVELPDPLHGWDECERPPWHVRAGALDTDIAWTEKLASGHWRVGLRQPADFTADPIVELMDADHDTVLPPYDDWQIHLEVTQGSSEAELVMRLEDAHQRQWLDSIMANVVGGDPNRNGVWGAEVAGVEPGAVIVPGSLELSHIWGRITGTVPGTRMPLANAPLSNAEYVAIACWIETLGTTPSPRANDLIDYDNCVFAWYPEAYAIR